MKGSSRTSLFRKLRFAMAAGGLLIMVACVDRSNPLPEEPLHIPFEHAFETVGEFTLQEDPQDSIAEIGDFLQTDEGTIIISDRFLPRVRFYNSKGKLLGAFGRFGDGPDEFRKIVGVGQDSEGRVWVADGPRGRFTLLSSEIQVDTAFLSKPPTGHMVRTKDGVVAGLFTARDGPRFHLLDLDGRILKSFHSPPPEVVSTPYWGSTAREYVASANSVIFAANSLVYPIHVYDLSGEHLETFGSPPPSWRPVPEVSRGEFTGTGGADRMARWLESFTVIGGLFPIGDSLLAVTHATLGSSPSERFKETPYAIDLYDLETGVKIFEDIELPEGTSVLGGGDCLFLLFSRPPEPWVLVQVQPVI